MSRQLEIDWTRARQLSVISAAEVADAEILEGGRPRRVKAVVLKAVLTTLDHHGRGRAAWISFETIARESRISLRQAKRAIQALEQESLIVADRRACNHYSIVWSELNLRCPSHLQFGSDSAAPVPHSAPVQDGRSGKAQSALGTTQSALGATQSALGATQSALGGTRTVPETYKNRPEPPEAQAGGGWELICQEWRLRISSIHKLTSEARASGESPAEFLARLRSAWEMACHPVNGKRIQKPAGAVVHWLRHHCWPVDGLIDPGDVASMQSVAAKSTATVARNRQQALDHLAFLSVKELQKLRQAGVSYENAIETLRGKYPPEVCERNGWT